MKKLLFSAVVLMAMGLTSCGGSSDKAEATADETIVEATEEVAAEAGEVDAAQILNQVKECASVEDAQAIVANVQTYVEQLVAAGKLDEAKAYLETAQTAISEKYPELASKMSSISSLISNVPSTASEAAETAVNTAKEAAEAKAKDAADKATDKANEAVSSAVDNAASKVKGKLKI